MKFEVDRNFTHDGNVVLWGNDGREAVNAFVAREALGGDGIPGAGSPTKGQLYQLAAANIEALSRIATAKFEAGEAVQSKPSERPWVLLSSDDLLASGEKLSANVLDQPFVWGTGLAPSR